MCHFQIRKTYHFQIRKINLFQIRKRVIFKYEKCDLYVFSNTNVTYFCIKRHAIDNPISGAMSASRKLQLLESD